ncbi:hypothetical protein SDC9_203395 [bioreactor metagenome]|uniref:Uncharacterized protein n=1 Tax=bioreactor metagenome TaxID=1076179 RepID=A0A645IWJ9_9ZZZZ
MVLPTVTLRAIHAIDLVAAGAKLLGCPARDMLLQIAIMALLRQKSVWSQNNHPFRRQLLHLLEQTPALRLVQMLDHVQRDTGIKSAVRE